jgi:hypothetical protein
MHSKRAPPVHLPDVTRKELTEYKLKIKEIMKRVITVALTSLHNGEHYEFENVVLDVFTPAVVADTNLTEQRTVRIPEQLTIRKKSPPAQKRRVTGELNMVIDIRSSMAH